MKIDKWNTSAFGNSLRFYLISCASSVTLIQTYQKPHIVYVPIANKFPNVSKFCIFVMGIRPK